MFSKFKSSLTTLLTLPILLLMGVTAKNCTLTFLGRSGVRYPISGYVSDVIGAKVTFEVGGGLAGATSDAFLQLPEAAVLIDYSQTTGPTVMTAIEPRVGGVGRGSLDIVAHVSTNASRPNLAIPVPAMSMFTAVQR